LIAEKHTRFLSISMHQEWQALKRLDCITNTKETYFQLSLKIGS